MDTASAMVKAAYIWPSQYPKW